MQSVNPAAIKKKKKNDNPFQPTEIDKGDSKKATEIMSPSKGREPSSYLSAKTGVSNPQLKAKYEPMGGIMKAKEAKENEQLSAKYEPMGGIMKAKEMKAQKHPEAEIEIELMLSGAKKKPDSKKENAYSKDLGYFNVEKDKEGKWKESGAAREKYLRKLKGMKK